MRPAALLAIAFLQPAPPPEIVQLDHFLASYPEAAPSRTPLDKITSGNLAAEFFVVRASQPGPPPTRACGLLLKLTRGSSSLELPVDASSLKPYRAALERWLNWPRPQGSRGSSIFFGPVPFVFVTSTLSNRAGLCIYSARSSHPDFHEFPGATPAFIIDAVDAAIAALYPHPANPTSPPSCTRSPSLHPRRP